MDFKNYHLETSNFRAKHWNSNGLSQVTRTHLISLDVT